MPSRAQMAGEESKKHRTEGDETKTTAFTTRQRKYNRTYFYIYVVATSYNYNYVLCFLFKALQVRDEWCLRGNSKYAE